MKFKVYTPEGNADTEKEFDIPSFEGIQGLQALKDVIVAYQANCRQGNSSSKTRAQVKGSGKKIYRQKGTGNARHGDKQAPIFVGGGVAHGPKPKDWSKQLNKKVRQVALKRAVFDRAHAGDISLIQGFFAKTPKTKDFASIINKVQPKGSVLLVDNQFEDNALLATRNIERVHVVDAHSVNAWDLTRFKTLLISEAGLEVILGRVA